LTAGSNTLTGAFSNAPGGILTSDGLTFTVNYGANGDSGPVANDVSLTVLAVPEPSAGLIAACGLGLGASLRPRHRGRPGSESV
jgi:hypothetical protein